MNIKNKLQKITRQFFGEEKIQRSRIQTREIGASGTPNFSGLISQDYNPKLRGSEAIDIYEEMRLSDGMVNATLEALKRPIVSAQRSIISVDAEDDEENEITEFVRKNLEDHMKGGFKQFIQEALNYKDFGFGYFEKVYEIIDGQVWLKKLAPRQQTAHLYWCHDGRDTITQQLPNAETGNANPEIPISKLVLFVNRMEGENYDGIAVLRSAYKHWYIKDNLYKLDAIKHERGAGILKIVLPADHSTLDRSDAEELGKNFKLSDQSYMVIPSKDWDVDLLTKGISDQSTSLDNSIKHHNRMIALNVLAQFLDLGEGDTGSYALSKDQSSFFMLGLRATSDYIEEVINKQIIEELVKLNFGEREKYPKVQFGKIGSIDFAEMSDTLEKLIRTGIVDNDAELKVWVRDTFGLPSITTEEAEEGAGKEIDKDLTEKKNTPRPLTLAEERVKFTEIENFLNKHEKKVDALLQKITLKQRRDIVTEVSSMLKQSDPLAIQNINIKLNAQEKIELQELSMQAYEEGKRNASNEIQKAMPETPTEQRQLLTAYLDKNIEARNENIAIAVKTSILAMMAAKIKSTVAVSQIKKTFDDVVSQQNIQTVGNLTIDNLNKGRDLVFQKNKSKIHALQRSEILDNKTCSMCLSLDGRVLKQSDPFTSVGQIHTNCRGIWVAILKTDAELPKAKSLPQSILNNFKTKAGVPTVNDFKQVKKPIITKNSRVQQRIDNDTIQNPNI